MRIKVRGGAAIPAVVSTSHRNPPKVAIPVMNAAFTTRRTRGGAAQPIISIADTDLVDNGGSFRVMGGPYTMMRVVAGRKSMGGPPITVYPVDASGVYDPTFNPGRSWAELQAQIETDEPGIISRILNRIKEWLKIT